MIYQDDLYIGTASVGGCPGTAGRFFKLDVATGSIEHDLDLVPEGCLGVGIWSSPTLDPDSGELYLTASNASICPETERYAMSMIELHADTLSIVGSWQVPAAEAVADGDFGATPTLFTARLEGVSRALVGAVNKNGIFYAFRRGEISAGPVWGARISSSPVAGCNLCPSGDETTAAWDGSWLYVGSTSTTIGGKFCFGSVLALDPATGPFSGSAVSQLPIASWLRRSSCLGLSLRLQDRRSSFWMRRRERLCSGTRTSPKTPRLMGRQRLPTACSPLVILTERSSRLRLPTRDSERLYDHFPLVSAYELLSPTY
jgi:hypothetical protein